MDNGIIEVEVYTSEVVVTANVIQQTIEIVAVPPPVVDVENPELSSSIEVLASAAPVVEVYTNYSPSTPSSGSSKYNNDIFGIRNGINQIFTTPDAFISGTTRLIVNGIRRKLGIGNDYVEVDNQTIRMFEPPDETVQIIIDYDI